MAQDFVLHGDFVQFNSSARCKACQNKDLKCVLQHSDEGCMACAGAGRDCIFSRFVNWSGPKSDFSWSILLHGTRGQEQIPLKTPAPSLSTPTITPFVRELVESPRSIHHSVNRFVHDPTSTLTGARTHKPRKGYARSDSSSDTEALHSRKGIDPTNRDPSSEILTIAEQEQEREIAQKNQSVARWLDGTSPNTADQADIHLLSEPESLVALRSRTESDQERFHPPDPKSYNDETNDKDEREPFARRESESLNRPRSPSDIFLPKPNSRSLINQSPTFDAFPWAEPLRLPASENTIAQPATSNQAIVRFARCATSVERASRSATESDSSEPIDERVFNFIRRHPKILSHLTDDLSKPAPSTLETVTKPVENITPEMALADRILAISQGPEEVGKTLPRLEALDSRHPGFGPAPQPGSAHQAASTSASVPAMRTSLAKLSNDITSTRLLGGKSTIAELHYPRNLGRPAIGHDGLPMFVSEVERDTCKNEILRLNPRILDYLLERMTQEQVRRHERLYQLKNNHFRMRQQGRCPSGPHCFSPSDYSRWLETAHNATMSGLKNGGSQYSIHELDRQAVESAQPPYNRPLENEDPDDDTDEVYIGSSTLPSGYPVPPNQSFPTEFECPFCFRLKRVQKPSDWIKHIHEDIQPFVCTFKDCWEPRSFKRKADWVRHENERHRQLEWWTCNMKDCSHKCFRKDNFVQHLVREHKLPEPKTRGHENRSGAAESPDDHIWKLVDSCRHETSKSPKDETCKFCGNVCNSWKKLTVHVAKHMENIAIPIWRKTAQDNPPPKPAISPTSSKTPLQAIPRAAMPSSLPSGSANNDQSMASEGSQPNRSSYTPVIRPFGEPSIPSPTTNGGRFYQCDVSGCTHERGFATQTDLNRHQKGVHGIYPNNDSISYRCVGRDCNNADKIWPRRDNFRGHLSRMHPHEDIEELTERSVIRFFFSSYAS